MKLRFLSITLIILFTIFAPVLSSKANAAGASSILVNMAPENPGPNENVTITLNSYAYNLDSVLILWAVDGKTVSSGMGKKSFSLNAPNAGAETNVTATISLPDGAVDSRMIIRPSVMVLLWQANDSYVPPFYRGKALPTADSQVKVVAMPEIKRGSQMVDPANMVYAWKQDYTNNVDGSGYGKNYFVYTNDYLENSNNIDVVASTTDQNYSSEANISISTYQPKIVFYKKDPKFGALWEYALADGHQIQSNEIIQAAPYFISPAVIDIPFLTFDWFINDMQIAVPSYSKNYFPVAVQAGVSGTSKIRLEVNNTNKIFETASKEINVSF